MSDKVYEFNSSNAVGQLREIAITKWLENRVDVLSVEDVSGDTFYSNLDIDLIVIIKNAQYSTCLFYTSPSPRD